MTDTKEAEVTILLNLIEEKTGYSLEDLKGTSRKREIIHVRRSFFAIARKLLELSFERIGEVLDKNHSTVIHNLYKHNEEIDIYDDYSRVYHELHKHLEVLFIARTTYNADYMQGQIDILMVKRDLIDKRIGEYRDKIEKLNAGKETETEEEAETEVNAGEGKE